MKLRPLAALILREWRTSWSDRGAYAVRAGYAGALLLGGVGVWLFLPAIQAGHGENLPGLARSLHLMLAEAQFALATLMASMTFARAVSREQERGTIDLLILSPLTRTELLLGKFVGEFMGLTFLIACGIPVVFLLLPFGGISLTQILLVQVVIAAQVALVGGLSVGLSALLGRALPVMACVWVLVIGWSFAPAAGRDWMPSQGWLWYLWDDVSPFAILDRVLESVRPRAGPPGVLLGVGLLVALLACGLGSLVLEQRLLRGAGETLDSKLAGWVRRRGRSPRGRLLLRPLLRLDSPLMRREFAVYRDVGFRVAWPLLAIAYTVLLVRLSQDGTTRDEDKVLLAVGGLAVGSTVAVLLGALSVGYDRLRGRLQVLIAAGVSPEEIARARLSGMLVKAIHLMALPAGHLILLGASSDWVTPGELIWRLPAAAVGLLLGSELMMDMTLQAALMFRRPEVAGMLAVLVALPTGVGVMLILATSLPGFALGLPLALAAALASHSRVLRKLPRWVLR
jgi:hypothetical protein